MKIVTPAKGALHLSILLASVLILPAHAEVSLQLRRISDTYAVLSGTGTIGNAAPSVNYHLLSLFDDPFGIAPSSYLQNLSILSSSTMRVGATNVNLAWQKPAGYGDLSSIYFGNIPTSGGPRVSFTSRSSITGTLDLRLASGMTFGAIGDKGDVVWGASSGWPGDAVRIGTWEIVRDKPQSSLNSNMFLATVAGATSNPPSTGTALGNIVNYYKGPVYSDRYAEIEACVDDIPPGCDPTKLYTQQQQEFAKFSGDVGTVAVEVNNTLQGKAIGSTAVDTSVWDGTLLAKLKSFADFLTGVKTNLQNAIDFHKTVNSSATGGRRLSPGDSLEPIVINAITGTMYWDDDGESSWLLSDLQIDVDIAKDYLPDIAGGQAFGSIDSLYPGSTAFGVFYVNDVVDPPGYNSVSLSLRQIDYLGTTIPEPATLALLGLGLAGLGFSRRKQ